MKILVTGGAGFIGSHVVDTYVDMGHKVVALDNMSHGKTENINSKAKFVHLDVRNFPELEKLFLSEKFDVVNHHAAQMNVRKSVEDPIFDAEVNIIGSLNLIRLSIENKVRRFIFASTGGALYGEPEKLPVSEDHPKRPISQYGLAKWTVEQYLFLAYQQRGLEYVALRYGNVYGPRQDAEGEAGVIAIFIDRMKKGLAPQIYGDGEQTRDYVYVGDVAEANGRAIFLDLRKLRPNPKSPDDWSVHVATGEEVSVNTLAEKIGTAMQFRGESVYLPARTGEVEKIYLDIRKSRDGFTLRPRTLAKGLGETILSFH